MVVFDGVDPDFVAKAIAEYAAEPSRRLAMGTHAELARLSQDMPTPLRGIREVVEPASTRTTVRRILLGLLLLAAFALIPAGPGWLDVAAASIILLSLRQLYLAYAGWRGARRRRTSVAPS